LYAGYHFYRSSISIICKGLTVNIIARAYSANENTASPSARLSQQVATTTTICQMK